MKRLQMLALVLSIFAFWLYRFPSPTGERIYADSFSDLNWNHLLRLQKNPTRIQRMDAPFQLFQTENFWLFLLLDTRNGRVWQVHWHIDPDEAFIGTVPINEISLIKSGEKKPGRFTLYPTINRAIHLLLDQENGNVWLCQHAINEPDKRFLSPITATLKGLD